MMLFIRVRCDDGHPQVNLKPLLVNWANFGGIPAERRPVGANEILVDDEVVARRWSSSVPAGRQRFVLHCRRCGRRVELLPETANDFIRDCYERDTDSWQLDQERFKGDGESKPPRSATLVVRLTDVETWLRLRGSTTR